VNCLFKTVRWDAKRTNEKLLTSSHQAAAVWIPSQRHVSLLHLRQRMPAGGKRRRRMMTSPKRHGHQGNRTRTLKKGPIVLHFICYASFPLHAVPAQRVQLLLQLAVLLLHVLQLSRQALPLFVEFLPRRSLGVEVRGVDLRLRMKKERIFIFVYLFIYLNIYINIYIL